MARLLGRAVLLSTMMPMLVVEVLRLPLASTVKALNVCEPSANGVADSGMRMLQRLSVVTPVVPSSRLPDHSSTATVFSPA